MRYQSELRGKTGAWKNGFSLNNNNNKKYKCDIKYLIDTLTYTQNRNTTNPQPATFYSSPTQYQDKIKRGEFSL